MWWNRAPSCVVMCDHKRRGQKSDASGLPLLLYSLSAVIRALKKPDVKVTHPVQVKTMLRTLKNSQVPDVSWNYSVIRGVSLM